MMAKSKMMKPFFQPRAIFYLLSSILVFSLAGCSILGVAAYKLAPPQTVNPKYTNLAGQSVGIMVWADRGIRIDWPSLSLDLANTIQNQLTSAQAEKNNQKNLKYVLHGTTFPFPAASFVRYQQDHPEIEAMPIAEVAPRLGVSRLIYVELQSFATRSYSSVDLFRGQAKADVKVFEIKDGKATMAQEWPDVEASYPPDATPEGESNLGDARTYIGTVNEFGTNIAHLFIPYQVEPE